MRKICVSLAVVASLLFTGLVAAQCWGQQPTLGRASPTERIVLSKINTTEYAVSIDGKQVGNFDLSNMTFRPCDSKKWGDPIKLLEIEDPQDWREHGVDKSKLKIRNPVTSDIEIPDDSKKLRVTVIGGVATRAKAVEDITDAKLDVVLWQCSKDHWSLADTETGKPAFKNDGSPTIYVQAPDGKVLHRQDDDKGVVGAIRKASKDYKFENDPDLRKEVVPLSPLAAPIGVLPMLLMLAGAAFVFFRHQLGV